MNVNQFLLKLVDEDSELKNIAFREDRYEFINLISNFKSKLAIAISSSFFNKNIQLFSNMDNINNIKSIISLPFYNESEYMILVVLDSNKYSEEFCLIDQSDSLIRKNETNEISDEIANDLIKSINNSENAISINLNAIFEKEDNPKTDDNYDEILDLYVDDNSEGINKKAMAEAVYDDDLDLNEAELQAFKDEEFSDEFDEILELHEDEKKPLKKRVIPNRIADEILKLKEERFSQQNDDSHEEIPFNYDIREITSSNILEELSYSKKRQNPENLLTKNNKRLIDGEVQFRNLGKIADLRNIDVKNNDDTILIASCKLCDSKLVYHNREIDDFKGEIYVEISNVSQDVLDEYLYEYLDSTNGMDELLYYSKGYGLISADLIKAVKIPVPPIEVQEEIVKVTKEAREFFKTVDLLKKEFNSNILDYKHISKSINDLKGSIAFNSNSEITTLSGSWRHAYQGLIWPLAISYLLATKGGFEIVEKKNNYLTLFEFIAAFNTIILLSGLPDDIYLNNFDDIWTDRSLKVYKKNMTFGTWVILLENLAEIYRNNNLNSNLDEELSEKITSESIIEILKIARNLRNEDAHSSITNASESQTIIDKLDNYLEDIFNILEVYSNYKMIYTTGKLEVYKQGFNHEVILLNGPCAQPIYDSIIFDVPLMSDSLYLYNPQNNKKILIKDTMMKFKPIDKNKKRWALFLYNSCDKRENNAFYKCFQSKENDYRERISSFRQDILL